MNLDRKKSHIPIKTAKINTVTTTTMVEPLSSSLVGQETFFNSTLTSFKKFTNLPTIVDPSLRSMAGLAGFEPTTNGFGDRRSSN